MPSRLLREGILDSERMNQLDWAAEVFYRRLMSVVDDFGLFDARPPVLRSRLYPLKVDRVSTDDISGWLAACEKAGLIATYSAGDQPYLLLHDLGAPRAKASKFPRPPAGLVRATIRDNRPGMPLSQNTSVNGCEQAKASAPYSGSGSGSDSFNPPPTPAQGAGEEKFLRFFQAFPKQTDQDEARKVFFDLDPDDELFGQIMAAIEVQSRWPEATEKAATRFRPPARWLRKKGWLDSRPKGSTEPKATQADRLRRELLGGK